MMPYLEQWDAEIAGRVQRLRDHAIEVADALDAALSLRAILAATDLPHRTPLTWDEILAAQPTELDRADAIAKLNRAVNPDALPEHKEHPDQ